jgi:ABC-type transporter Mla subunit MlaD
MTMTKNWTVDSNSSTASTAPGWAKLALTMIQTGDIAGQARPHLAEAVATVKAKLAADSDVQRLRQLVAEVRDAEAELARLGNGSDAPAGDAATSVEQLAGAAAQARRSADRRQDLLAALERLKPEMNRLRKAAERRLNFHAGQIFTARAAALVDERHLALHSVGVVASPALDELAGIEHAFAQLRSPSGLMQELAAGLETEEPAAAEAVG